MRLRVAVVGAALAAGTVCGMSAPAHAALPRAVAGVQATWTYVEYWDRRGDCINAGQEYEREGWKYKCVFGWDGHVEYYGWDLYILD